MAPLRHHTPTHAPAELTSMFKDLHELIKNKLGSIAKTGPAKDHHMKNGYIPTHNIFKPGAHPSKKKDDKKDEHKKEENHHESKAE
jgi:hypothetical protein